MIRSAAGPSRWRSIALLGALPLTLALAAPALLWDLGCFEEETATFVRQYTAADGRSVLQKVFDPHANDLGTYQARELSYLIDLLDAHAYPHLAVWIDPGFSLPLSALLASLVLVALFVYGIRHHGADCGRLNATLLVACLVSSFCYVSTMGLFYRSAKPVLAVVVVGWVFLLLRIVRQRRVAGGAPRRMMTAGAMGIFVLTIVAGLLDRQGVYMAIVAAILLVVHVRRTGELRDLAGAAIAAVAVLQVYGFVLAPWIIQGLNGYSPDFTYQRVPAGELLRLPNHLLRAAALLVQNTLLLFGGHWITSGALAAVTIGAIWRHEVARGTTTLRHWISSLRRSPRGGALATYGGWLLLSQLVMFALMIARHGVVYRWIDHRFWYYPLPFVALLTVGVLLALHAWMPSLGARQRRLVPLVLGIAVASNLATLDHRRDIMATGPWFGTVHPQCELLKASLREGAPDPGLQGQYRVLFDHSRAAQAAIR